MKDIEKPSQEPTLFGEVDGETVVITCPKGGKRITFQYDFPSIDAHETFLQLLRTRAFLKLEQVVHEGYKLGGKIFIIPPHDIAETPLELGNDGNSAQKTPKEVAELLGVPVRELQKAQTLARNAVVEHLWKKGREAL